MIKAAQFVEAARVRGFNWYAGVPCSFLTPLINFVSRDPSLHYISAGNEGDAVALIAGVTLGSMNGQRGVTLMQNSGLGNAVSPLTSLTWTYCLPQLLVVTWRGQPGIADEPQHGLMGLITPALLKAMEIPWETFPMDPESIGPALDRAVAHMDKTGLPYALVMQKGTVAPFDLERSEVAVGRLSSLSSAVHGTTGKPLHTRREALQRVISQTPAESTVVLASTGYCGRELYALSDRPNHLYMVGSMGCLTLVALGLALVRPDLHVVAVDGDGAALMRMSAFATVGAYGPPNLTHLLLDNGVHESTGGQATVSAKVSFAEVAAACGYSSALESEDLVVVDEVLTSPRLSGPRFVCLAIRQGCGDGLPRPTIVPSDVKRRLMNHIAKA